MTIRTTAPTPIEWGIIAFGVWHARDLWSAWQHSPKDGAGGFVLLIWLIPFVQACWQDRGVTQEGGRRRNLVVGFALASILTGALGSLNALIYVGLAAALTGGAWTAPTSRAAIWFISSASWMPGLSYALKSLPNPALIGIKFGLAILGVFAMIAPPTQTKSP